MHNCTFPACYGTLLCCRTVGTRGSRYRAILSSTNFYISLPQNRWHRYFGISKAKKRTAFGAETIRQNLLCISDKITTAQFLNVSAMTAAVSRAPKPQTLRWLQSRYIKPEESPKQPGSMLLNKSKHGGRALRYKRHL